MLISHLSCAQELPLKNSQGVIDGVNISEQALKKMLLQQAPSLSAPLSQKVWLVLQCAAKLKTAPNSLLTVIDYSKPSNEKRLWVFDLKSQSLLFHTHVTHGIKTGVKASTYFSNIPNSKTSSIGVYQAKKAYFGRYGLSLRLEGLEPEFNGNAKRRAIVMHGVWYANQDFIDKYGRPGRSWGCPAIPKNLSNELIDVIKNDSLLIAYYPSSRWLQDSKFLNCGDKPLKSIVKEQGVTLVKPVENKERIVFIEKNDNHLRERDEPVVAMEVSRYQSLFKPSTPPLKRMIRKRIDGQEYVVLNAIEFERLIEQIKQPLPKEYFSLSEISFITPVVIIKNGAYFKTEFRTFKLNHAKNITKETYLDSGGLIKPVYQIHFKDKTKLKLEVTRQFIRWIGL